MALACGSYAAPHEAIRRSNNPGSFQRVGVRGGSGLLVDEELLRAIRSESSSAIQYWWGVTMETVWQAAGVLA
jgi:hypothetical protein